MYLDRFNLRGRVAIVTGGAQSIGLACVEALSEAGAHVYITDRNPTAAAEDRAEMKAKGYATDFIEMEVIMASGLETFAREDALDRRHDDPQIRAQDPTQTSRSNRCGSPALTRISAAAIKRGAWLISRSYGCQTG
jgi:hypothetical protein